MLRGVQASRVKTTPAALVIGEPRILQWTDSKEFFEKMAEPGSLGLKFPSGVQGPISGQALTVVKGPHLPRSGINNLVQNF